MINPFGLALALLIRPRARQIIWLHYRDPRNWTIGDKIATAVFVPLVSVGIALIGTGWHPGPLGSKRANFDEFVAPRNPQLIVTAEPGLLTNKTLTGTVTIGIGGGGGGPRTTVDYTLTPTDCGRTITLHPGTIVTSSNNLPIGCTFAISEGDEMWAGYAVGEGRTYWTGGLEVKP